jgi:hypothetical protein
MPIVEKGKAQLKSIKETKIKTIHLKMIKMKKIKGSTDMTERNPIRLSKLKKKE